MINKKAFIFDTVAEALAYKIGADAKNTTYRTSFADGATIHTGEPDIPYYSEILIRETSQVWRCNQWWGGTGDSSLTDDEKAALSDLVESKNPLTITVTGANNTLEVGSTYQSPGGTITVKKGSTDVTSQSTLSITSGTISGNTWSDRATSANKTWTISATYNGKKVTASRSVSFKHYLYSGVLASEPVGESAILTAIKSVSKSLNDAKTLGATNLSAGKCYIFAVYGSVNLVCRENSTNGIVSATKGTITVERVNKTASDTYSYIIVPASSSNWTFKITNS